MGRSPRIPPITVEAERFVVRHLGKDAFAPFTGQDSSAWRAFVYLLEMYSRGDNTGRAVAIRAMNSVLRGVQNMRHIHLVFAQTIAHVLDWGDVEPIWKQLGSNWDLSAIVLRPTTHAPN